VNQLITVFAVMLGEYGDGGSLRGIYATEAAAVEAALKEPHMRDYPWTPDKDVPNRWESGCDWLTVTEWIVVGSDAVENEPCG